MHNIKPVRVGAVSYQNTLPLLYGMKEPPFADAAVITLEYPAVLARQLREGLLDIALLPVAAIPEIPGAAIVGQHCIAADGEVASVCLFSHQPLEQLDCIYLDYQSRTSVKLAEVLLNNFWKKEVTLLPAPEDYIARIAGSTGGIIIGDRALQQRTHFPFVYDLAGAWKQYTGLPFVFAAWVAVTPLPESFIRMLNLAAGKGLSHLKDIAQARHFKDYDLLHYYTHNIQYQRTAQNQQGLELFLRLMTG